MSARLDSNWLPMYPSMTLNFKSFTFGELGLQVSVPLPAYVVLGFEARAHAFETNIVPVVLHSQNL